MTASILLYGATGFSGRLIIDEFMHQVRCAGEGGGGILHVAGIPVRLVIAARERSKLKEIADKHGLEYRAFGLDDQDTIVRGLSDIRVVLNAAGPFAWTARALATSALLAKAHYVDINGEVDVYQMLDDLATNADNRKCAIVCGAGCSAIASDLLVDRALATLAGDPPPKEIQELGAIRIAMTRPRDFSRGSAETAWRSIREQVTVVRGVESTRGDSLGRQMKATHEAIGRLERTFDFAYHEDPSASAARRDLRIATAVEAIDTLTAQRTATRRGFFAQNIETYMDMGAGGRLAYQVGALTAPIAAMTWVRELANFQIGFLPPGPSETEREAQRHVVVLEVEDVYREKVIDLRFETPNAYQFTAQVAIAAASRLASEPAGAKVPLTGWLTPSQVLPETQAPAAAPPSVSPQGTPLELIIEKKLETTDALSGLLLETVVDPKSVAKSALSRLAPQSRADQELLARDKSAPLRGCNLNLRIGGK